MDDNIQSPAEKLRTPSYISISSIEEKEKQLQEATRDNFNLVHIIFLLFGLLHLMPITFLVTANDYWMNKFRNTTQGAIDLNHRTTLQSYFTSGIAVAQAIPTVACTLLTTFYGHKFKIRSRILWSLSIIASCYILCVIFIKIDVDTWQTGFFFLTLAELALIQAMLALFQVTSLVLLSKFPANYMKPFLFGQGIAGIFSSSLQVISLAIGGVPETSALIYFCTGTVIILITIVLFIAVKYLETYKYYVENSLEDTNRKVFSYEEQKLVASKIWPCLVIFMTYVITLEATHPSITSLVVSENYGHGNPWNDKYFVPVITFLFSDICSIIGRVFASGFITAVNGPWLVSLGFLRTITFVPLVILCHATPRSFFPVVFDRDWEYILILGSLVFMNGFIQNAVFLSVPNLCPQQEELGLLLLIGFAAIATGAASPLGLLIVKIL